MKQILILVVILISCTGFSQLKEINPTSTTLLDLNAAGEKAFNDNKKKFEEIQGKLSSGVEFDDLTQLDKEFLSKFDESKSNYWNIVGDACSWYCDGGPKEVRGSSYLKAQGGICYAPQNAHDLSYKNAWVEGVEGYGIGEYLLYTFSGESPRITDIIVVNGYVKSRTAWENNSRVKKLKVYIDNVPFAILNLEDIRGSQVFKVEPIGNSDRKDLDILKTKPDWTLKFEIVDVYLGLKYDDVAISEIYFDGLDVH